MKEIYQFKAWYYDEDEGEKYAQGFVATANYTEAVSEVAQYFGDRELVKVEVKWVSEISVLLVPNSMSLKKITEHNTF